MDWGYIRAELRKDLEFVFRWVWLGVLFGFGATVGTVLAIGVMSNAVGLR